jgi:hypothetical protein
VALNKNKKSLKKDFIIISKTDIAYLQNFIIESAVFVAQRDADIALLSLSLNELEKILKKIRKNKKDTLYLNKINFKTINLLYLLTTKTYEKIKNVKKIGIVKNFKL